jgi:hypothetical protein
LKTGVFRSRSEDDLVTAVLNYDYSPKRNEKMISRIKSSVKQICNDNDKTVDVILRTLGYCITGQTKEQKFLSLYGLGSNGKSLLLQLFTSAFSEYTIKIDNRSISKEYNQKRHKMMELCIGKRLVYMEEIEGKTDEAFLKDLTDGVSIVNEVLYAYAKYIKITFKLLFVSNDYPAFSSGEAMNRRGMLMELTNRFVDQTKMNELKAQKQCLKGVYLKNTNLLKESQTLEFKLSFVHLILQYSMLYYKNDGLGDITIMTKQFESASNENDYMKSFIEQNYEITNLASDKISKYAFESLFKIKTGYKQMIWSSILTQIKKCGLCKYDNQGRLNIGKNNSIRGVIVGLKLRSYEMDEDEDEDEEVKDIDADKYEQNIVKPKIVIVKNVKVEDVKVEDVESEAETEVEDVKVEDSDDETDDEFNPYDINNYIKNDVIEL